MLNFAPGPENPPPTGINRIKTNKRLARISFGDHSNTVQSIELSSPAAANAIDAFSTRPLIDDAAEPDAPRSSLSAQQHNNIKQREEKTAHEHVKTKITANARRGFATYKTTATTTDGVRVCLRPPSRSQYRGQLLMSGHLDDWFAGCNRAPPLPLLPPGRRFRVRVRY